jgi:TonB family protein
MIKLRHALAVATTCLMAIHHPVALATDLPAAAPVIHELDRLANKDQPVSLPFNYMSAVEALTAIAAAGGLRVSMEGPEDCCTIGLQLIEVPLRRALELVASAADARFEVVSGGRLRVWLPETPMPEGEDGITLPVLFVNSGYPVYPEDARAARAEGRVLLRFVLRWDGTIGNVQVLSGVAGWPSLDRAAIDSVRQLVFQPAMKRGQPVSIYSLRMTDFRVH